MHTSPLATSVRLIITALLFTSAMCAQGTITTIAGGAYSPSSSTSPINWLGATSIAVDASGNLYVGEQHRLWIRNASSGTFALFAEATLDLPIGIPHFGNLQFDGDGVLWYFDVPNRCVLRLVS